MSNTHNDNPVVSCQLDRDEWRKSIIRQLVNADPPKVIGIHGTWGSGKTSLMAQMYTDLGGDHIFEPDWLKGKDTRQKRKNARKSFTEKFQNDYGIQINDIQPIWFEAWQYQHEPNILAALLKEIRDQLSLPHRIWNDVSESALAGITSLLQSISFKFKAFGAEFGVENPGKYIKENLREIQKERISEPLDAVLQKKMLREAIAQLLKLNVPFADKEKLAQRKAVIFIDDLDRCIPDTAFRILESIKVYLNLDNCVFVLGMDLKGIERILARYYEKQLDEKDSREEVRKLARLYMEKICQDVHHLPILSRKQRLNYFKFLIREKRTGTQELLKHIDLLWNRKWLELPPFPRTIKIFSNVILSHLDRDKIKELALEGIFFQKSVFLSFTYLYTFHFDLFHLCMEHPDFYNNLLLQFCMNPINFEEDTGGHPAFENLYVPKNLENPSENASGDTVFANYPDMDFRQILWIRNLIVETGTIDENIIDIFRR